MKRFAKGVLRVTPSPVLENLVTGSPGEGGSGEGYLSFLCDLGIMMKMGPIAQGLVMRGFERSQYQSYAQPP